MAKTYNTIGTFTAGQVLTAAQMNGIGTNVNNTRVPPICLLRRTSNSANLTQNTTHVVEYATANAVEDVDTDGMHSLSTNTGRITPTTAGVYLFVATVQLTSAPNFFDIRLTKNGSDQIAITRTGAQAGGVVTAMQSMNGTTDYVETVINVGTGTFQIATANSQTTFQATWLGQAS
jgi:hypothetical protein